MRFPSIQDTNHPILFSEEDKKSINIDISKASSLIDITKMKKPNAIIERIIKKKLITVGY